ncbi:MAG: hypothetical protein ACI4TM_04230, partial [Candidatus Cryptobacteroides sp.]
WALVEEKSDEFDTWNPDKWGTDVWVTSKVFDFKDDNVTVSDGCLRLAVRKEESGTMHYTAGRVKSKFTVGGNSALEIRAKLVKHAAHVSNAIWISDAPTPWQNPNLEIDIVETMPDDTWPDWKFSSGILYWWLKAEGVAIPDWVNFPSNQTWMQHQLALTYYRDVESLSKDFHVFRLERYGDSIKMYVDGDLYWDRNWKRAVEKPAYFKWALEMERPVILSIESHSGNPVDEELPGEFLIDYVRFYELKTE